jgi:hypothetical protein
MLTRTTAGPCRSKLLSTTELSRRARQKDSLPGQILSHPNPGRWHALAREANEHERLVLADEHDLPQPI